MRVGHKIIVRKATILSSDIIILTVAFNLLYSLQVDEQTLVLNTNTWGFLLVYIISFALTGAYSQHSEDNFLRIPIRTFWISVGAGIIYSFHSHIFLPSPSEPNIAAQYLTLTVLISGSLATYVRVTANLLIFPSLNLGYKTLYLGSPRAAIMFREIVNDASKSRWSNLFFKSRNDDLPESIEAYSEICNKLSLSSFANVVIDPSLKLSEGESAKLISAKLAGINIQSLNEYFERKHCFIPVDKHKSLSSILSQEFSVFEIPKQTRVKRLLDLFSTFTLALLCLPLLCLGMVLVKINSNGPLFFRQTRIGLRGKNFTLYKLRTMRVDAEKNGPQWTSENDTRVIPSGRFLRKTRIDEIPQFWNILRGEMSVVGPRPERPEFQSLLSKEIPYYNLRHVVKPGITGWAQVCYPYGASVQDALKKFQYDLYYIKHYSPLLDLNIILRTLIVTVRYLGR